ncbi:hypothetical protein ACO9S2_03090 [Nitrospira sp. NS4]|uniref:polysaccharide deacetylase WbmS family protein n=1 Tax=Nitrospira sp. NS4 TaxID=3414498 RepID=UPI003C2CCD9A
MSQQRFGLTLDVDWAPDCVIDAVAQRLEAHAVRATWFITHLSPAVERLRARRDLFELGIHPNFLPGSTHGCTHEEVLRHCMHLVPEAVSMRSHSVYQSGSLYACVLRDTPIRVDSSTFLPEMAYIRPLEQPLPGGVLKRIPFIWGDDYELCKVSPCWDFSRLRDLPGLQIFLFHPIHVYLNTVSFAEYEAVKRRTGPLSEATAERLQAQIKSGLGIASLFDEAIDIVASAGGGAVMREFL